MPGCLCSNLEEMPLSARRQCHAGSLRHRTRLDSSLASRALRSISRIRGPCRGFEADADVVAPDRVLAARLHMDHFRSDFLASVLPVELERRDQGFVGAYALRVTRSAPPAARVVHQGDVAEVAAAIDARRDR